MVTPTSPWVAFELGAKTDDPLAMYLNDFCTVPMPLAGLIYNRFVTLLAHGGESLDWSAISQLAAEDAGEVKKAA